MPIPAPAGPRLFAAADLSSWLGKAVTDDRAQIVESVVWGWLKGPLGLAERPADVPDEVFSWAIELAAIAHENPAGLDSSTLGPYGAQFSSERRNEILALVASTSTATAALSPRGSFPPARAYPDALDRY